MVQAGKIQFYGMATWNGFRQEARARDAMQLAEFASIAHDIAGDNHHFRFVQLPFNLGMTEALTMGSQTVNSKEKTAMEAASDLGITLVASASLLQGQVTRNLPSFVAEALGLESDAQRALQFVRRPPASPPLSSAWPTPNTSSPIPSSSPSPPPPSINSANSSPAANPPSSLLCIFLRALCELCGESSSLRRRLRPTHKSP